MSRPPSQPRRGIVKAGLAGAAWMMLPPGLEIEPPEETPPAPAAPPSIPTGHSHNDYYRRRPLHEALDLGFGSIEVDVFPIDGDLLVGHHPAELTPDRTLDRLYLEPLLARCRTAKEPTTGPRPAGGRLTLLIDLKRDGERALEILRPALEPLKPWLRRIEGERLIDGPIEIVLSGSRPMDAVASESNRSVFIDGRVEDLDRDPSPNLVPMISSAMHPALGTYGITGLNDAAVARLEALVARTHEQGRRLRFWGHLESTKVWKGLVAAGVDHIGTDRPELLARWLRANDPRCGP